jgi:hypothetical protein
VSHVHAIFDGIASCVRYPRDSAFTLPPGLMSTTPGVANGGGRAGGGGGVGDTAQPRCIPQAAKEEQSEVSGFVLVEQIGLLCWTPENSLTSLEVGWCVDLEQAISMIHL